MEDTAVKTILAQIEKEAPPVHESRPEVPADLSTIVTRLLAKDPAKRYQQPVELAQALVPFIKAGARPGVADISATPSHPSASGTGTMRGADTSKLWGLGPSAGEEPTKGEPPAPLATAAAAAPRPAKRGHAAGKWIPAGWYRRRPVPAAVAGVLLLLGLAGLWASGVFKFTTPRGTIVVEDVPDDAEVRVEGQTVTLTRQGDEVAVTVVAEGPHRLKVVQGGREVWSSDVTVKLGGAPVRGAVRATP